MAPKVYCHQCKPLAPVGGFVLTEPEVKMVANTLHKPRKILLAVDGSKHSLAAVVLLRDLPLKDPAQPDCLITILGVLNPREASNHAVHLAPLKQSEKLLQEKSLGVETTLVTGYPAEVILEHAKQYQSDLIVMGAKGMRATLGILLGGVAQQVVEYTGCPVLIVRAPYQGMRRVLLTTDGSASSQATAEYLAQFPLPADAQVQVAHVLPPASLMVPEYLIQTWSLGHDAIVSMPMPTAAESEAQEAEEELHGQKILDQAIETLAAAGVHAGRVLLRGDTATELMEYIKAHQIDLVVTGSRGLSQMQSWLLGSVSRKLVHYANCSVLVVRGAPEAQP